jgi:hypothetical protein
MAIEVGPRSHSTSNAALFRALGIGAVVGTIAGGGMGTSSFPVVGTAIGAVIGCVIGVLFGVANGLVLAGVVGVTTARWVPAIACALTTLGCAAGLVSVGHWWGPTARTASLVFVAACTLLATALGPIAGCGARPVRLGRRIGQRPVGKVMKAALSIGAAGGTASGALIGVGIGIASSPRTAPVAAIEGAVLAAVSGAAACLLLATLVIAPKLRVR